MARLSALVLFSTVGCSGEETGTAATEERITVVGGQPFESLFTVVDTLTLEEPRGIVTVLPRVTVDRDGGFLLADEQEHQVRVYSPQGRLRQTYGAGTPRPDSIRLPQRAIRLPNGHLLVVNIVGPVTIIPADSALPSRFLPLSLRTARNAVSINSRTVVLAGSDSNPVSATLFRLDLEAGRLGDHFFPPPEHLDRWVTTTFSSVLVAGRGSRVAAVHMLSDTLTILDESGRTTARIAIPIDPFRVPGGPLPNLESSAAQHAWITRFTMITDLFWVADDQFVVQWVKPVGTGLASDWGVLQMDTTGALVWAMAPSPTLVAVANGKYYFRDPAGMMPNRWLVATRKVGP